MNRPLFAIGLVSAIGGAIAGNTYVSRYTQVMVDTAKTNNTIRAHQEMAQSDISKHKAMSEIDVATHKAKSDIDAANHRWWFF